MDAYRALLIHESTGEVRSLGSVACLVALELIFEGTSRLHYDMAQVLMSEVFSAVPNTRPE